MTEALRRIIGIALVRNEEYFVHWSLTNAAPFCDELLVVDSGSTDATREEVELVRARYPHLVVHQISDPNTSHRFLEGYAGQKVWVFGVDGDEIFDPQGLARLRPRILAGEFDRYWALSGYMLHAVEVDLERGLARGYINPAAPRATKLFNFGALDAWIQPDRERLHGHDQRFRPGYHRGLVLDMFTHAPWEECDLRALHLCFFPRSSADTGHPARRKNPFEYRARGIRKLVHQVKSFLAAPFSKAAGYKSRRYRRGPVVTRDIGEFGRPGQERDVESRAQVAEGILARHRG